MLETLGDLIARAIGLTDSPNPSLRKIGIAMAAGTPVTFYLSAHSLVEKKEKEVVTIIPHYWCFPNEENRHAVFIAGKSTKHEDVTYKIQYYTDTGHAYYDAGSMSEVA